jgi:hypothetical protein
VEVEDRKGTERARGRMGRGKTKRENKAPTKACYL